MPIFLSYSRKDEDVVEVLAQGLADARIEVWFDQDLGGGDAWWDKILENIRSASVFVFALSDESLHSKPCRAELDYARELDRPVLPVQVGPVANLRSSPVADLQTITFRSDSALSAFKIMAAIEQKAHELKPLPNPLPTPPPIPYAYLLALGRQIDSTELDQEQQTTVVDQLHRAILEETDEGVHQDIVAMLRSLMNKPWATRRTELAAKGIIRTTTGTPDEQSVGGRPQKGLSAEESDGVPIPPTDNLSSNDQGRRDKRFYGRYIGALIAAFIAGSLGFLVEITEYGLARALFGFLAFGGPVFLVAWLITLFSTHLAKRRQRR